jgi:predicted phosphodiesterase
MTTILCVSDIHDNEEKHKKMAELGKGCDFVITCGDDFGRYIKGAQEENIPLQELG